MQICKVTAARASCVLMTPLVLAGVVKGVCDLTDQPDGTATVVNTYVILSYFGCLTISLVGVCVWKWNHEQDSSEYLHLIPDREGLQNNP